MSRTPHDALFKATFSQVEHAAAALRAVLPPALAARIDFGTLAFRPGSFIDEELAASHSDLLFSARLARSPILLYVLYEHQSTPARRQLPTPISDNYISPSTTSPEYPWR